MTNNLVIGADDVGIYSNYMRLLNAFRVIEYNNLDFDNIHVNWGNTNMYWSETGYRGKYNIWEYYFEPIGHEPVSGDCISIKDYYPTILDKNVPVKERIPFRFDNGFAQIGHKWRTRVHPRYRVMPVKFRQICYDIVSKYGIKPRDYIIKYVDNLLEPYTTNRKIGVHVRKTDAGGQGRRKPVVLERFYEHIDKIITPDDYIVIATDEQQILSEFVRIYGDKILYQNCIRHEDGDQVKYVTPNNMGMPNFINKNPQLCGEQVVKDVELLSRCDYFIHNLSSVSTAVLGLNPSMSCCYIQPGYSGVEY